MRSRADDRSARTKISYWDRPKSPRDWHWFLGRLGSTLIASGLLVFAFVGYQLWGTGIEAAQSQQRLESEFADRVLRAPDASNSETSPSEIPPTEPIAVSNGDSMALIEIPAIGVRKYVVAGVETADLKKGPGHYPKTALPGELGNAAIAGHRTTYGEPFRQLDELVPGDQILVTDLIGRRFTYLVTSQRIVTPQDSWVVDTVDPTVATLTLTTCHPEFSAKQRLIVFAELDMTTSAIAEFPAVVYAEAPAGPTTATTPPDTDAVDITTPLTTADSGEVEAGSSDADVFDKGWFSDPSAIPHVVAWIALEIVVVLLSWLIAKKLRNRAIGAAVGFLPFLIVLYFVFQNVNRLLPPNL